MALMRSVALLLVAANAGAATDSGACPTGTGSCAANETSLLQVKQHHHRGTPMLGVRGIPGFVKALYTFGAPATANPPLTNFAKVGEDVWASSEYVLGGTGNGGTFDGLRVYTKSEAGQHDPVSWMASYDPKTAAVNTCKKRLWPVDRWCHSIFGFVEWYGKTESKAFSLTHALMDAMVLKNWWKGRYYEIHKSTDPIDTTVLPKPGGKDLEEMDVDLHDMEKVYLPGLKQAAAEMPKDALQGNQKRDVVQAAVFANAVYYPEEKLKEAACNEGMVVVEREERLALVQDPETMNCILAFRGTAGVKDKVRDIHFNLHSFCGWGVQSKVVHGGFAIHLKEAIEQASKSGLIDELRHCKEVTVTGHSLGGAAAELFTACVNKRHFYKKRGLGNVPKDPNPWEDKAWARDWTAQMEWEPTRRGPGRWWTSVRRGELLQQCGEEPELAGSRKGRT